MASIDRPESTDEQDRNDLILLNWSRLGVPRHGRFVGGGAFYFNSSGTIRGHQVVPDLNAFGGMKVLILDDVGLFVEGKFNRATITNFDGMFGLSGEYRAFTP
ncbi:hypothetical protein ACYX34_01590 [Nitrospira sp. CMX1]